jgi:hypothetical protein
MTFRNPGTDVNNEILYGATSSSGKAAASDSSGRHTGDSSHAAGVAPGTQHSAHGPAVNAPATTVTSNPHSSLDNKASTAGTSSGYTPSPATAHGISSTDSRPSNADNDASGATYHKPSLLSKLIPHGHSDHEETKEAKTHPTHREVQPEYGAAGAQQPNNPLTADVNKPLPGQPYQSTVPSGTGPAYGALPDRTSDA